MDDSRLELAPALNLGAQLRAQQVHLQTVREALRRQADLLRRREMESNPAVHAALAAAAEMLIRLTQMVAANEDEIDQLRTLSLTSALINSSLDVDTVLAQSMDELIELTGAERGFIVLFDGATGTLQFRIARGLDVKDLTGQAVSRTLLRHVLSTGQPVITANASDEPMLKKSETLLKFALRSVMCVPLIDKGKVEGAIYVDNRLKAGVFTEDDLPLLVAFANQAAVALHNARLYADVQATIGAINRARVLMENVFASIGSGVITAGAGDRILTCNEAAGLILGYSPQAAPGQPLAAVLPLTAEQNERVRAVVRSGQTESFIAEPHAPGRGRIILSLRVSPLRNAAGAIQGAAIVFDDLTEQEERDETLRLMTRYLPPGMVDQIQQIVDLAMGGERRDVTCVFVTACSFSAFPPGLRPTETMTRLNQFLEEATRCVHRARGVVDKYLGGEIMVLFNTQLNPEPAHAAAAVEMALELRAALADLSRQLGPDAAAQFSSIGIHSGVATLGNVGSWHRRSFTALGDTINLARRVHETVQPGQILITEATTERLPTDVRRALRLEARPALQARGRQQATGLFEVFRDG
jgi:PAS domain S-box-containing protein